MKKQFKRILLIALSVVMTVGMFAACGNGTESSSAPESSVSEPSRSESSASEPSEQSESSAPEKKTSLTSNTMYTFSDTTFSSAADFDKTQILAGLEKLGITADYSIVLLDTDDRVVKTAADVLARFFKKADIDISITNASSVGEKQIILATNGSSDAQKTLFEKNKLKTLDYTASDDVSHVVRDGNNIVIGGSNGRGVLYGVYDFEEFVMYSQSDALDIVRTWDFRTRGQSAGFYWNPYENFRNTEITRERVEYLSRLGTNLFFPCFDGSGYETFFMSLVKSEVFPFQRDPDEEFIRKIDTLIKLLADYGIDYYQWITEPGLPGNMGGDMTQYPEGALGKFLLYGKETPTLCINNEKVQEYYTEMMVKFINRFPDCKGVILYNIDCNAYFCDTGLCETCKNAVGLTSQNSVLAWENVSKMVTILADAADTVSKDFEVVFWPAIHHSGSELDLLLNESHFDALWGSWTGTDHDLIITNKTRENPLSLNATKCVDYANAHNIPFYCGTIINRSEAIPQGFCYPYSAYEQIYQVHEWGFTSSIESTGPTPSCNSVTALTMKQFWSDTSVDPDEYIRYIMTVQFGTEAGELMFQSAKKTEEAMSVWDNYGTFTHPLGGSKSLVNIGHILSYPASLDDNVLTTVKSWGALPSADWLKDYKAMATALTEAADLAEQALAVAPSDQYIRYAYYTTDGFERPTCKEYAEMVYSTARFAALVALQRCDLYYAATYHQNADTTQQNKGFYPADLWDRYHKVFVSDLYVQRQMRDLLQNAIDNNTYFVRANMTVAEANALLATTKSKINTLIRVIEEAGYEYEAE